MPPLPNELKTEYEAAVDAVIDLIKNTDQSNPVALADAADDVVRTIIDAVIRQIATDKIENDSY